MGPRIRSGTDLVDRRIWGGAGRKFGKKVENPLGAMEESGIPPEIHLPTSPGVVRGMVTEMAKVRAFQDIGESGQIHLPAWSSSCSRSSERSTRRKWQGTVTG